MVRNTKIADHPHLSIPKHSRSQAAMFFALASELGFASDRIKDRAIRHFNLRCFNEITTLQMGELIDALIERQRTKPSDTATDVSS